MITEKNWIEWLDEKFEDMGFVENEIKSRLNDYYRSQGKNTKGEVLLLMAQAEMKLANLQKHSDEGWNKVGVLEKKIEDYENEGKKMKNGLKHSVEGALKDYELSHDTKIEGKLSISKRIAGNLAYVMIRKVNQACKSEREHIVEKIEKLKAEYLYNDAKYFKDGKVDRSSQEKILSALEELKKTIEEMK